MQATTRLKISIDGRYSVAATELLSRFHEPLQIRRRKHNVII
jgi:hypothetical protein